MFTVRNVVSEVTVGFLDQTMMWAVGNLQGQGAGPMSERERCGESSELMPWHVADAHVCVWMSG